MAKKRKATTTVAVSADESTTPSPTVAAELPKLRVGMISTINVVGQGKRTVQVMTLGDKKSTVYLPNDTSNTTVPWREKNDKIRRGALEHSSEAKQRLRSRKKVRSRQRRCTARKASREVDRKRLLGRQIARCT